MSVIDVSRVGDDEQPSPSVWAGCPRTDLNDLGLGSYVTNDFNGDTATLPGMANSETGTATFEYNPGVLGNRILDMGTGPLDNNAVAIFTRPLATVRRQASEQRVWFETRIAFDGLDDRAGFFGLARLAGLTDDILLNDPGSEDQAGLANESVIGFVTRQVAGEAVKLDAVIRNGPNPVVTVLEDVTNASALSSRTGANGQVVQNDLRGDLVANEFVKLGVVYNNNKNQIEFYVKGIQVAAYEIDANVDQLSEYGGINAVKAGAPTAKVTSVDFIRVAGRRR